MRWTVLQHVGVALLLISLLGSPRVRGIRSGNAEDLFSSPKGKGTKPVRKKLVIDADPGCDDTVALLCAFGSGEYDVMGVTTVFGNADIDHATENALRLLPAFELNAICDDGCGAGAHVGKTPVYRGAGSPLVGPTPDPPTFVHGEDGLGDAELLTGGINGTCGVPKKVDKKEEKLSAAEFLVKIINKYPGEVSIACIGRLTNLAKAIKLDPDLPEKWAHLAIMGGAFFVPGNVSPYAEENFWGDATAAQYVFQHAENAFVVGLDVTNKSPFTKEDMAEISVSNSNGQMLGRIYDFYMEFYTTSKPELNGAPPHDAIAWLALIHPELFVWKSGPIVITTSGERIGQSTLHGECSTTVSAPINNAAVSGDYLKIIEQLKDYIMHPRPPFGKTEFWIEV